jgi:MFS family permease
VGARLELQRVGRLLTRGQFAIYNLGNSISMIGSWMQRLGAAWLMWEMTQSSLWLGILAAADLLPTVILGPFAGAAADRWDRLTMMRLSQVLLTVVAFVLFGLLAAGRLDIPVFVGLIAVQGCINALNQPARNALLNGLVARDDLTFAVAIHSVNVNLARFIGPAVTGVIVLWGGMAWVFFLNALSYLFFLGVTMRLRVVSAPAGRPTGNFFAQTAAGIGYVARHDAMRVTLILLLLAGFCVRPVSDLLPAFVDRFSDAGAAGLAILSATLAGGALLGGMTTSLRRGVQGQVTRISAFWIVGAAAVAAFAAAPWPAVNLPALVLAGFCASSAGISTQALVQTTAEEAYRGRAVSLHGLIFRGGPALGALMVGWLGDRIGHVGLAMSAGLFLFAAAYGLRRAVPIDRAMREDAAAGPAAMPAAELATVSREARR